MTQDNASQSLDNESKLSKWSMAAMPCMNNESYKSKWMREPIFAPVKHDESKLRPCQENVNVDEVPTLPEFLHTDTVVKYLKGEFDSKDHPMNWLTDKDKVFSHGTPI